MVVMRFEVLAALLLRIQVFWDVVLCLYGQFLPLQVWGMRNAYRSHIRGYE